MWEHFSHQADVGIKAQADSLDIAFEEAAIGLIAIVTDPAQISPAECMQIECKAENLEMLFFEWLSAIVYEISTSRMLFSKFEVSINDLKLSAKMWGERIDFIKHDPAVEPKAVTFNQLAVTEKDGKWTVQCVIDV